MSVSMIVVIMMISMINDDIDMMIRMIGNIVNEECDLDKLDRENNCNQDQY